MVTVTSTALLLRLRALAASRRRLMDVTRSSTTRMKKKPEPMMNSGSGYLMCRGRSSDLSSSSRTSGAISRRYVAKKIPPLKQLSPPSTWRPRLPRRAMAPDTRIGSSVAQRMLAKMMNSEMIFASYRSMVAVVVSECRARVSPALLLSYHLM